MNQQDSPSPILNFLNLYIEIEVGSRKIKYCPFWNLVLSQNASYYDHVLPLHILKVICISSLLGTRLANTVCI